LIFWAVSYTHLDVYKRQRTTALSVMVESADGLREWKDVVYIFLSEDRSTAFQRALEIGCMAEECHEEGRQLVASGLSEVSGSNVWARQSDRSPWWIWDRKVASKREATFRARLPQRGEAAQSRLLTLSLIHI